MSFSEKIEAVLSVDTHARVYNVEMRPHEARLFARSCYPYGHTTEELVGFIEQIDKRIPGMSWDESRSHHMYHIGREGTRVVYLHVIKVYLDREYKYYELMLAVGAIASKYGADEFRIEKEDEGEVVYRVWWDR
jgi:hypothetical protein